MAELQAVILERESRTLPDFLRSGDVVEVDIPGVGLLRNTVEEDRTAPPIRA